MKKLLIIFIVTFSFSFSESSGLAKDISADKNFIDGVHYTKHWAWVTPSSSEWAKVIQPKCKEWQSRDILTYSIRDLSIALKTAPQDWLKGDYLEYINDTCSIEFSGETSFKSLDKAVKKWKTEKYISDLKDKYISIDFIVSSWNFILEFIVIILGFTAIGFIINAYSGRHNRWQR